MCDLHLFYGAQKLLLSELDHTLEVVKGHVLVGVQNVSLRRSFFAIFLLINLCAEPVVSSRNVACCNDLAEHEGPVFRRRNVMYSNNVSNSYSISFLKSLTIEIYIIWSLRFEHMQYYCLSWDLVIRVYVNIGKEWLASSTKTRYSATYIYLDLRNQMLRKYYNYPTLRNLVASIPLLYLWTWSFLLSSSCQSLL